MLDEKMFGDVPQKIHKVVANTLEALEERTEKVKKSNNRQWGFGRAASPRWCKGFGRGRGI